MEDYGVKPGSSIDIIERCMRFYRAAADFHGVLDSSQFEGESLEYWHIRLNDLERLAVQITNRESSHGGTE